MHSKKPHQVVDGVFLCLFLIFGISIYFNSITDDYKRSMTEGNIPSYILLWAGILRF